MKKPFVYKSYVILALAILLNHSCAKEKTSNPPNVILIMADDMGYECLNSYEDTHYKTPELDAIASNGILFSNCVSQPLCTPSRVKIMTGLYNYKNYDHFGYLDKNQYTFGNLMKDAGYETCIAGKWQLNGLAYKDELKDWSNNQKPIDFGFDEYCLWQLTKTAKNGERFSNPLIEQNGTVLAQNKDAYGPEIFSDFIVDFIDRKKEKPFFVYYPMVLVHDPFVPTPDSNEWSNKEIRYKNDTTYFKDMVAYTDKIVGKIVSQLKKSKVLNNTIVIFTGDNGTHPTIYTVTKNGTIKGGKGTTSSAGTHVPLVVSWPDKIKKGLVYEGLISFSDFFATLKDITNSTAATDGISFYPLLKGEKQSTRESVFVHYDPQWGKNVNKHRNQFVRTLNYKLYGNGDFFNIKKDVLEKKAIPINSLTAQEIAIKQRLERQLQKHPKLAEK